VRPRAVRGIERYAGHRFEQRGGAVLEDAIVARQQQRGVVARQRR